MRMIRLVCQYTNAARIALSAMEQAMEQSSTEWPVGEAAAWATYLSSEIEMSLKKSVSRLLAAQVSSSTPQWCQFSVMRFSDSNASCVVELGGRNT